MYFSLLSPTVLYNKPTLTFFLVFFFFFSQRSDVFFNFSEAFEIHDDNEVLKRMQLQKCSPDELPKMIPEPLIRYLPEHMWPKALKEKLKSQQQTQIPNKDNKTPSSAANGSSSANSQANKDK